MGDERGDAMRALHGCGAGGAQPRWYQVQQMPGHRMSGIMLCSRRGVG
jgi:hypothetical protein